MSRMYLLVPSHASLRPRQQSFLSNQWLLKRAHKGWSFIAFTQHYDAYSSVFGDLKCNLKAQAECH